MRTGFDLGVKFGEKYGNQTYSRAIYKADYAYENKKDPSKELKMYITYRIAMNNKSTTIDTRVNSIVDYFDNNYTINKIGTKLELNNQISDDSLIKNYVEGKYNGNYKKIVIGNNTLINSQSVENIYIEFELNKTAISKVLSGENKNLDNVAEINSYSVFDKNGNPYAGIDINSNPGNCNPEDITTYEDDTDKAPDMKILFQEQRSISGTVFVDKTSGDLVSGIVRQGDGIYKANEDGVLLGVKVKLVDLQGNTVKVYDASKEGTGEDPWQNAETTTNADGSYTIGGYIPGEYKIVYTWGDKDHKVQDYKSTIVDKNSYENKGIGNGNGYGEIWYKQEFKQMHKAESEGRRSDAVDDYEKRLEIDEQTKVMTNFNKQVIETYDENASIVKEDGTKEQLITKMDSTTPSFKVNLEYNTAISDCTKEEAKNRIEEIDFGIVERARQLLELDKRIKKATVTLANGNLLIDANSEDANDGKEIKYTQFITNKPDKKGFLKIEIDAEVVQGATLDVTYDFEVANKSELDYVDKNFYLYGEIPKNNENIVTLNPNSIIDYLDNNLQLDTGETPSWNILQGINEINDMNQQGLISGNVKTFLSTATNIILKQEGISGDLKPLDDENTTDNETMTSLELKCSKLLASNDYAMEENHAEIIKIIKSGGSSLITTPGNYIPKDSGTSEADNSDSENITILNQTGLETDVIAYTLLVISSLGILVVGIILIKKYIMK